MNIGIPDIDSETTAVDVNAPVIVHACTITVATVSVNVDRQARLDLSIVTTFSSDLKGLERLMTCNLLCWGQV